MDRLTTLLDLSERALLRLQEALSLTTPPPLQRDGAIQRFEYSFEITWKACQRTLAVTEGLHCASPKACLRAAAATGQLGAERVVEALGMCDDRNMTSHTYNEGVAELIHERLPAHAALMAELVAAMRARVPVGV
ncbi:MAG: hypothetical protein AMXMBFR64_48930 [Myxococcales bacterium]